jgi:nitroimidazol reductase NimA-like FMN-containing flavoprotein (pyridoxamine 5'-phosphate oxidase superfamily)
MPLTREELEEILSKPVIAHIAVVSKGRPHVSPIWIHYESGRFYFTTRLSRVKGKSVAAGRSVAISIATNDRPYKAIIVEGIPKVVEKDKWEILRKISTKYGKKEGEAWLAHARNESDRVAVVLEPKRLITWDYGKGDYVKQNAGVSMVTKLDK